MSTTEQDIIIVGGGISGAALAYGLSGKGRKVTVLDAPTDTNKASRTNVGLIWCQSKFLHLPEYAKWGFISSRLYPALTKELEEISGHAIPVNYTGGIIPVLSEEDYQKRGDYIEKLREALGEYKGIEVPKESVSISKAEVDAELARMQERNARIETVDREAKTGDTVVLDFEGFVDGKPFDGGKAEGYTLTLGSGAFIPGFEDQLVGLKAGDEKDVVVTFPENYTKELAGKEATFKCKIHEVKETIKPELDDEFAKDVSEYDTLAALKKSIKADLAKKRQEAVDRDFENEAVVLAGKNMTCDIPACMIDEQVDKHLEQFAYQLQSQGMKMEDYVKMIGGDVKGMRDSMRPMAEQTVRSNILLSEIVHQENIDVTDEEVEEELKKLAEQYKVELDKIKEMIDVEAVKSDLKGRKAVKLIVDNAKPVEKEKEKKAAKKSAKKEDEAAEAPAEEAPKAEE